MSNEFKKNKKIINQNLDFLRKDYGVKRIGVFGSVARGKQRKNSDIDILIEFSQPIGLFRFIELEDFLSKKLKRKVDLVSRKALKPVIKSQILKEVIYAQKNS